MKNTKNKCVCCEFEIPSTDGPLCKACEQDLLEESLSDEEYYAEVLNNGV